MKSETYEQALRRGTQILKQSKIPEPRFEAELFLSYVLDTSRIHLLIDQNVEMTEEQKKRYDQCLLKRSHHQPYAQIVGKKEFMGLDFIVTPDVLIPRPDTENIVENALQVLKAMPQQKVRVLDLCCGSGAIGISIAYYEKKAVVTGADLSVDALKIAKANAQRNRTDISLIQSDLFQDLSELYDLIVTNPPYIPTREIDELSSDVKDFEPKMALDGGETGLDFYQSIFLKASDYLTPGGMIICECGWNQVNEITCIAKNYDFSVQKVIRDLSGLDRGVVCRRLSH